MTTRRTFRSPSWHNLTGVPAMSVPLHWTVDGLPLGEQFVAPLGDEATLLQLAAQLVAAQPWLGRLAPMAHEGCQRVRE